MEGGQLTAPDVIRWAPVQALCWPDTAYFLVSGWNCAFKLLLTLDLGRCGIAVPGFRVRNLSCYSGPVVSWKTCCPSMRSSPFIPSFDLGLSCPCTAFGLGAWSPYLAGTLWLWLGYPGSVSEDWDLRVHQRGNICRIYWNWWTYIDTSLSPKLYSLPLWLILGFILTVGVDKGIRTFVHHYGIIQSVCTYLKFSVLYLLTSCIISPWKPLVFCCVQFCLFQNGQMVESYSM